MVVVEEPGEEPKLYRQDTGELITKDPYLDPYLNKTTHKNVNNSSKHSSTSNPYHEHKHSSHYYHQKSHEKFESKKANRQEEEKKQEINKCYVKTETIVESQEENFEKRDHELVEEDSEVNKTIQEDKVPEKVSSVTSVPLFRVEKTIEELKAKISSEEKNQTTESIINFTEQTKLLLESSNILNMSTKSSITKEEKNVNEDEELRKKTTERNNLSTAATQTSATILNEIKLEEKKKPSAEVTLNSIRKLTRKDLKDMKIPRYRSSSIRSTSRRLKYQVYLKRNLFFN